MKAYIIRDVWEPCFSVQEMGGDVEIDVSEDDVIRWTDAISAFEEVQREMEDAFNEGESKLN